MRTHILDKRAHQIADAAPPGNDDDLLTTACMMEWLAVSRQWLEIGRSKGWGPPWVRLAPRVVRYRRGDVIEWLKERTHRRTAEYAA
jgi:predicted DNA-binding transcriptional regulator AlpA